MISPIEYGLVVIIGAGISGFMTAFELLRTRRYQVLMIESEHVAAGSTSRSAAASRAQWGTETMVGITRWSELQYHKLPALLGKPDSRHIQPNGYLFPLYDDRQVARRRRLFSIQQRAGLKEVQWLEPAEVFARWSHLENPKLKGATFCPIDGFCYPAAIVADLLEWCELQRGFRLMQHTKITKVERSGRTATRVITDNGDFPADAFINCTGPWAPRVARLFHTSEERAQWEVPLKPEKRYLHCLRKFPGWPIERWRALPMMVLPSRAYCRPEGDQLMIGWEHEARAEPECSHDDQNVVEAGFGHVDEDSHGVRTWPEIAQYIPAFEDLPGLVSTNPGYYDTTADYHQILDFDPFVNNLIHMCGMSGHGIMGAPFNAEVVASLIAQGPSAPPVMILDGEEYDLLPFVLGPHRTNMMDPTHL